MRNKKGQVTVEYILLGVVFIVMFQLVVQFVSQSGGLDVLSTPRVLFRSLVENGNLENDRAEETS